MIAVRVNSQSYCFTEFPGKPGKPVTLSVTDTSVVLKWKEGTDGNTPIEKYIIQYKKSGICLGNRSQNINFIASVTTNSFIFINSQDAQDDMIKRRQIQ